MKNRKIYLAGGLFDAAERTRNIILAYCLEELGCEVILPQKADIMFRNQDGTPDIEKIVDYCKWEATNPGNIIVASIDGADADSGTSMEVGMALMSQCKIVLYRTDFRTDINKEIGFNAMFRGLPLVYLPCYITERNEMMDYYRNLARKIIEAIDTYYPEAA
jgi:nucleoside 2-deoxyribosyltransferase